MNASSASEDRTRHVKTLIVGAGFSGLGMAVGLDREGHGSFLLLEKASGLGGTWRDNHYPGCACDVPSHLYSFSFLANPGWTRMYAPQPEILTYLEHCADQFNLRNRIRFNSEVEHAAYDERRGIWVVRTTDGRVFTSQFLVLAMGPLSRPSYPRIPGLERFGGTTFHSATWNHDYDLNGKRAAVIGTGASAIQFVPQIAPRVASLHLFQRTAPWVLPRPDRPISDLEQRTFTVLPALQKLNRYLIYALLDLTGVGYSVAPGVMKLAAALGRRHIRKHIRNPELREAVTPRFVPGCKRILLSNDYYPALDRSNVDVITTAIQAVGPNGIRTVDGREHLADVIIFGTGFRVTDLLTPLQVLGRGGADLNEVWGSGMEAYCGTHIAGFPNLFMLLGPNTGLGNNSMIVMLEAQIRQVLSILRWMQSRGAASVDVLAEAQTAFNAALQRRLGKTVWATGCQSWYLDEQGRNPTIWPGFSFEFWLRTRRLRPAHYAFEQAPSAAGVEVAA